MGRRRIIQPPTTGQPALDRWMREATDEIVAIPPMSVVSTSDGPNSSAITGSKGDLLVDIGSATTKFWQKTSDTTATSGWEALSFDNTAKTITLGAFSVAGHQVVNITAPVANQISLWFGLNGSNGWALYRSPSSDVFSIYSATSAVNVLSFAPTLAAFSVRVTAPSVGVSGSISLAGAATPTGSNALNFSAGYRIAWDNQNVFWWQSNGVAGVYLCTVSDNLVVVNGNGVEFMRWSGSTVVIGGTTNYNSSKLYIHYPGNSIPGLSINDTVTGVGSAILFFRAAVQVGSIVTNAGTTTYNTTSDRRTKRNIRATKHTLKSVLDIKVCDFDIVDGAIDRIGVIAQELYEVAPEAVNRPAKETDFWGVDYGRLTPRLVVGQQQIVQAFKTFLEANTNTPGAVEALAALTA